MNLINEFDATAYETESEREEREAFLSGVPSFGLYDFAGRRTTILH